MVQNFYGKCKVCNCEIRLRFQVGYSDIPVSLYCPICHSHLLGHIMIDQGSLKISPMILNFEVDEKGDSSSYTIELSTEFVTKKYAESKNVMFDLTPFIRNADFDESINKRFSSVLHLSNHSMIYGIWLETLFNILERNQIDFLPSYLESIKNQYSRNLEERVKSTDIENVLDSLIYTKHYATISLSSLVPEEIFNYFSDIGQIVTGLYESKKKEMNYFLRFLAKTDYFSYFYKKVPVFICQYLQMLKQLLPIYQKGNDLSKIDLVSEGLTTLSVTEMHHLYANGYELLCDSLDIICGLNNIQKYGDYDNFGNGRTSFDDRIANFGSKFRKYEWICSEAPEFTNHLSGLLDNVIRNSEAHNSIKIDGLNQIVTFINCHKGKTDTKQLYFAELGKKCIDIFSAILVIWEYYYQLIKLKLISVDHLRSNYVRIYLQSLENSKSKSK